MLARRGFYRAKMRTWPLRLLQASALLLAGPAYAVGQPVTLDDSAPTSKSHQAPCVDTKCWEQAALSFDHLAKAQAGTDAGRVAKYELGVALFRLALYQPAYSIFCEIADDASHPRHAQTFVWLAALADILPEPADVAERLSLYDDGRIEAQGDNIQYLIGRYKYRSARYEDALRLFARIDRKSPHYLGAQLWSGMANVLLRRTAPAVLSFKSAMGGMPTSDDKRMIDLAHLSLARTWYSTAFPYHQTIDRVRLEAAIEQYNQIDGASSEWQTAVFEQAWAYFMIGDDARALGNLHTVEAPYFTTAFPEAAILRSLVYFANCRSADAATVALRFLQTYQPLHDELLAAFEQFKTESEDAGILSSANKASPAVRPIVAAALSDRELGSHIGYVSTITAEGARFATMSPDFRESALGSDVTDTLELARALAAHDGWRLARRRYQRSIDELAGLIRDATNILVDISSARGNLDKPPPIALKPDGEHVIWPFTGEYWRDELGTYRERVVSQCGK